jgi:hypothetical protein
VAGGRWQEGRPLDVEWCLLGYRYATVNDEAANDEAANANDEDDASLRSGGIICSAHCE